MDSKRRIIIISAGAAAALLVAFVIVWRVSAAHARDRAADLVSASADLVRCAAGDDAQLTRASVRVGFHRRLVAELPDVAMTGDCELAFNAVKEKYTAYRSVWFGSASSTGREGKPLGASVSDALEQLGQVPFTTPTDKVLRKRDPNHPLLKLGDLAFDVYEAAVQIYAKDGASESEVKAAAARHLRETRQSIPRPPASKPLFTVQGKVDPKDWSLVPGDASRLTLFARSDKDQSLIAWTDDAGNTWGSAVGIKTLVGKKNVDLRTINAPNKERWYVASYEDGGKVAVGVGKIAEGSKELPEPTMLPDPPDEWKRAPGGEREAVILANGVAAMPVWRVGEVSKEKKKAIEDQRKQWEKNFADPATQVEMMLKASRDKARESLGLDEDHERVDGILYSSLSGSVREIQVRELPDYGLGGLIGGSSPQMLVGKGGIPALDVMLGPVPAPGEELGVLVPARAPKPANPAFRGPTWFGCIAADGTTYGLTEGGTILMAMKPGMLELVQMTALADEGSHVGCGMGAAIIALPFLKDRIFASVLTIRLGEIEGAKVASTAGTHIDEYNKTVSTGVVPGAVSVAWVAEGFVLAVTSTNWGTEFRAPVMLAEAGDDGSVISGVRLIGMDKRMVAVFAREKCNGNDCTTSFETLVSEDATQTWRPPS
jgi:hypothetical protein